MSSFDDEPVEDWTPGPEVTKALYAKWRKVRRGNCHAEPMSNPVWDWLIRTRIAAYTANEHFGGPDSLKAGPAWCFARFGCSRTLLPDGRTLFVAGEHEDHYDPDFFIYNDVVVRYEDDSIDVYGYPESDFPPTDFHSATLVANRVILIGNLSYAGNRRPGQTQVLSLDIHSLGVERIETSGECPGWIFNHSATLENDAILIRGGEVYDEEGILENIDDWMLDLQSLRWTRLTDRQWPRFELVREDGEMNSLWQLRHAVMMRDMLSQGAWGAEVVDTMQGSLNVLDAPAIPLDTAAPLLERLYRPAIAHDVVPRDEDNFDEHNVYRIKVDDVIARYVEDSHSVVLTVEGELPPATLDRLVSDLRTKLSQLEGSKYLARRR